MENTKPRHTKLDRSMEETENNDQTISYTPIRNTTQIETPVLVSNMAEKWIEHEWNSWIEPHHRNLSFYARVMEGKILKLVLEFSSTFF